MRLRHSGAPEGGRRDDQYDDDQHDDDLYDDHDHPRDWHCLWDGVQAPAQQDAATVGPLHGRARRGQPTNRQHRRLRVRRRVTWEPHALQREGDVPRGLAVRTNDAGSGLGDRRSDDHRRPVLLHEMSNTVSSTEIDSGEGRASTRGARRTGVEPAVSNNPWSPVPARGVVRG